MIAYKYQIPYIILCNFDHTGFDLIYLIYGDLIMSNWWNNTWHSASSAFNQTNHDAVSVGSTILNAITGASGARNAASAISEARAGGTFAAAELDGGAAAVARVGIGIATPEIATPVAVGAGLAYGADFIDHFGQNMGWWKN